MANAEHVEALKQGHVAFNQWRKTNGVDKPDFTGLRVAEFRNRGSNSVSNYDFTNADFSGAVFQDAIFNDNNCTGADFSRCITHGKAEFSRCNFTRADFSNARLERSTFGTINFTDALLTNAKCREVRFGNCNLQGARIGNVDFYRAIMEDVDLQGVRDADTAHHLETIKDHSNVKHFGLCERSWTARWLSWESIRTLGQLRIFAVSISLLGFYMVAVQLAGLYNDKVNLVRNWSATLAETGNRAERLLASEIDKHLHPFHFSSSTTWWFIGLVLLGIASTIYAFACPDEIKEFTRSQWEHALHKNILHYWGLAWKRRYLRYICASFYTVGGAIFLVILLWKLAIVLYYLIWAGTFLPF